MKKETIIPQQIVTTWECEYSGCRFSSKTEEIFNKHVEEHIQSEKIEALPSKKASLYIDGSQKDFLYFESDEGFITYNTTKKVRYWEWVGQGWYVFNSSSDSYGDYYWSELVPAKDIISETEETFNLLRELTGVPTLQNLQDALTLATLELSLNMNNLSLRSETTNRVLNLLLKMSGESLDTPVVCSSRVQTLLSHLESSIK